MEVKKIKFAFILKNNCARALRKLNRNRTPCSHTQKNLRPQTRKMGEMKPLLLFVPRQFLYKSLLLRWGGGGKKGPFPPHEILGDGLKSLSLVKNFCGTYSGLLLILSHCESYGVRTRAKIIGMEEIFSEKNGNKTPF